MAMRQMSTKKKKILAFVAMFALVILTALVVTEIVTILSGVRIVYAE